MPQIRAADLLQQLEGQLEQLQELLRTDLNFAVLEEAVTASLDWVAAAVLRDLLSRVLSDEGFLRSVKALGARLGMRFKDYREVKLRLDNGQVIRVRTA